tara:strand:- start:50 stop:274 length:225 start_codon:yes stop_codon:yes gene_type:complete
MTNDPIPTKKRIKNLKNFASMDQSFKKWLATCPREYTWQIDEVIEDLERSSVKGTFTFRKINENFKFSMELRVK